MELFGKTDVMRSWSGENRMSGRRIGLVPTMGCLHDGHLSLVGTAKENADVVVLSNFVNPTQFGPGEDFGKYPRDLERDNDLCEKAGVDAVFAPGVREMYPEGASTWVCEEKLSAGLCGRSRPGHFRGVATIVAKLFNAVLPDVAVFGSKDYQQAKVIEKMVRDLDFPVGIIVAPIVREPDGLAMSSRNRYLSPEERRKAPSIYQSLKWAEKELLGGKSQLGEVIEGLRLRISRAGARVDYVEAVDAESLAPVSEFRRPTLIAVAAFMGRTRLIDNIVLKA